MLDRGVVVSGLVADAGVCGGVAIAPLGPPLRCCRRLSIFLCKCSLRYVFPMSLMLNPFCLSAVITAAVPCVFYSGPNSREL